LLLAVLKASFQISWLTHRVHIIEANGASYRLGQSSKRPAKRKKRAGQDGILKAGLVSAI